MESFGNNFEYQKVHSGEKKEGFNLNDQKIDNSKTLKSILKSEKNEKRDEEQELKKIEEYLENMYSGDYQREKEKNIETTDKIANLQEVLDKVVNEVINLNIKKLNSKEGINLSRDGIYENVLSIFNSLEGKISDKSLYKNDLDIIKNNFLLPKEKGLNYIDFLLKKSIGENTEKKDGLNEKNIDSYFSILESGIISIYDLASRKNSAELKLHLEEFKNMEGIGDVLKKFPDVNKAIFEVLPSFIKNTPKEVFVSSLRGFLAGIKSDVLILNNSIIGKENDKNKIDSSKLNIVNSASDFLINIINKDSVDDLIYNIKNLDIIKNNEIFSDIFDILNDTRVSKENKYELLKKTLEGIKLLSNKNISEKEIGEFISDFVNTLSDVSEKIPKEKISKILEKLGVSDNEKKEETTNINYVKLGKFLWENKDKIIEVFSEYVTSNSENFKDFIVEIFQKDLISKNIEGISGELLSKLREIAGVDLKKVLINIRKDLLNSEIVSKNKSEKEDDLTKTESDIIGKVLNKLEKNVSDLFYEKINSKENNNLTKNELINSALKSLKEFLNEDKTLIFDFLKELGYEVNENQKEVVLNIISGVLNHPNINNLIGEIISNIGKKVEDKKDILPELKNIFSEVSKTKGENILNNKNIESIKNIGIETIYDKVLGNKDSLKSIFELVKNNSDLNLDIKDENIFKFGEVLKNNISKENLSEVFKNIDIKNIENNNFEKIALEIYSKLENKTEFINDLIDSGVINSIDNNFESKNETKIDNNKVDIFTDILYETINTSDKKDLENTINKLFENKGFGDLLETKVLGKSLGENIVNLISCIDEKSFNELLKNNIQDINKLLNNPSEKEKIRIITDLGIDFTNKIDIEKFKKLNKNIDSKNEKTLVDLSDEFTEVISENSDLIKEISSKSLDIYDLYTGKIDKSKVDPENIKKYGEDVYTLFNKVISKVDEKYLQQNLDLNGSGGETNSVVESFKDSFLSENKFFIFKQVLNLKAFDLDNNKGNIIDSYFRNSSANRSNFGDTFKDFIMKGKEVN